MLRYVAHGDSRRRLGQVLVSLMELLKAKGSGNGIRLGGPASKVKCEESLSRLSSHLSECIPLHDRRHVEGGHTC